MLPEDKDKQRIWKVLKEIKDYQLSDNTNDGLWLHYSIVDQYDDKKSKELIVLDKLEEWGIIKNRQSNDDKGFFYFDLVPDKFEKIYQKYKKQCHKQNKPRKKISTIIPQYNYSEEGKRGILKIGKYNVEFSERVSLIVHYFFNNKDFGGKYCSYDMYNNFVKEKYNEENNFISSVCFRQSIDSINKRIRKETEEYVQEAIRKKEKKKDKEKNYYRWGIKYSNM